MENTFKTVIRHLVGVQAETEPMGGIDISGQFGVKAHDAPSTLKKLNAAFLIGLAGDSHPAGSEAERYIETLSADPDWKSAASFYKEGFGLIQSEIEKKNSEDREFSESLKELSDWLASQSKKGGAVPGGEAAKVWRVFFPEGVLGTGERDAEVSRLRERRKVRITRMNPEPVASPVDEVLFASNILLTLPSASTNVADLPLGPTIRHRLAKIAREHQSYWYDHPIQIGVEPEHNEAIYGLKGLSEALRFEQERGIAPKNSRLACVLSVSVTHKGLQPIAREYIAETLKDDGGIKNIDAYVFTEIDSGMLVDELLLPAAQRYAPDRDPSLLREIVGTDGEYGRHYTFLKAVAAFWQVLIDPRTRATFKVDLDQVFPQKELVEQTGASAFEHLMTPLWGAEGTDHKGASVELGMLAGALVNQRDIARSLFTPDVAFPEKVPKADELVFFSKMPQALSTEAEMMTRYTEGELDGRTNCLQRIHVTGGTNGILIKALRKHRPFTPIFIGRAEDQAYLMSVLFPEKGAALRYVHKDGLIMRHDKEAMAAGAMKAAALGKLIGDYVRILTFSSYARALPWPFEDIKSTVDPFTGCFISKIPVTLVYLRCALKAASFFEAGSPESDQRGREFLDMAIGRLHQAVLDDIGEPNPLIEIHRREKEGWDLFYDLLDHIEQDLKKEDPFALEMKEKAEVIVNGCRIRT